MELTRKEGSVVKRLRSRRVLDMKTLCKQLDVSHMTVVRALKKYGYHTSINHNGAFYTLRDIPSFDKDGLWTYRKICFSSHRTLDKTLMALVQNATAGLSVPELEQRLNTKVGNLLSRLCQKKQLSRCFVGRQAVYLAVNPQQQQRQRNQLDLQQQEIQITTASSDTDKATFPPRCDVVLVLEVLIQIIKTPKADPAELAKAIRDRGAKINQTQVKRVIDFYALQKKRNTRRR